MKTAKKVAIALLCAATIAVVPAFAACSSQTYVTGITKSGTDGVYTVYYSDGSTSTFTVPNSSDGVTAEDLYNEYLEQTGENISYTEFLEKYMTGSAPDTSSTVAYCLQ